MHMWYNEAVTILTQATLGLNMKNVKILKFSDRDQGLYCGKK